MVFKQDINVEKIAFEYLKLISQSNNKKYTITQIVDDIKKKYAFEEQQLILNELKSNLKLLDSRRQIFFEHYEVRAQSNENYLEYIKLLDSLTKG